MKITHLILVAMVVLCGCSARMTVAADPKTAYREIETAFGSDSDRRFDKFGNLNYYTTEWKEPEELEIALRHHLCLGYTIQEVRVVPRNDGKSEITINAYRHGILEFGIFSDQESGLRFAECLKAFVFDKYEVEIEK